MARRKTPPKPVLPVPDPENCRHCRNAARIEASAVAVPDVEEAARRRAAFERTLCDHGDSDALV